MKIGDTCFVHGYIDEIRKDVIIVRNHGGYFGTAKDEVLTGELPERKKGKWTIKNGELAFWDVCSQCGKMVMHKAPFYKFCPNCGADMRGDHDES